MSGRGGFDEGDFGGGEVVELIDELVDLAVGGFDLALEDGVGVAGFGGGELGVEVERHLDTHRDALGELKQCASLLVAPSVAPSTPPQVVGDNAWANVRCTEGTHDRRRLLEPSLEFCAGP